MLGVRRTAVAAAVLAALCVAWAIAEPSSRELPTGTPVVFVADGHLDAQPREGTTLVVRLRDPLVLDGAVIAAAGTHARLLVEYPAEPEYRHTPTVTLDRFTIIAGLMPVRPDHPITLPIAAGEEIAAKTEAVVEHLGSRYSIRVPFPFKLKNDKPSAYYTATPARTAPPHTLVPPGRRHPPPTPLPTTLATPGASSSPEPGAAVPYGSESPLPSPEPTKSPG
jgi:hypothetical protein